jgi:ABC-2 type transport system ATP-binding protein
LPARISFRLPAGVAIDELPLPAAGDGEGGVWIEAASPVDELHRLTGWALERSLELEALEVHRPSLEDIYLQFIDDGRAATPEAG